MAKQLGLFGKILIERNGIHSKQKKDVGEKVVNSGC